MPQVSLGRSGRQAPTLGFLGSDASFYSLWTAALPGRLRELGRIEGRTVAIESRWSGGRSERGAEIVAEFVQQSKTAFVRNLPHDRY